MQRHRNHQAASPRSVIHAPNGAQDWGFRDRYIRASPCAARSVWVCQKFLLRCTPCRDAATDNVANTAISAQMSKSYIPCRTGERNRWWGHTPPCRRGCTFGASANDDHEPDRAAVTEAYHRRRARCRRWSLCPLSATTRFLQVNAASQSAQPRPTWNKNRRLSLGCVIDRLVTKTCDVTDPAWQMPPRANPALHAMMRTATQASSPGSDPQPRPRWRGANDPGARDKCHCHLRKIPES